MHDFLIINIHMSGSILVHEGKKLIDVFIVYAFLHKKRRG